MKVNIIGALMVSQVTSLVAATYPVTAETLNCRISPDTSSAVKRTYKKNDQVAVTCQGSGPSVNGNSIWDKTMDDCWVADYYVKTGSSNYVMQRCQGSPTVPLPLASGLPGTMTDDYLYRSQCPRPRGSKQLVPDKWAYFECQCTSFVAWRINSRLGISFNNQYKGTNWGDANSWADAARCTGVRVDNSPVPGCIAQYSGGKAGHVAYVSRVSGDKVTIEEYNWGVTQGYGTRTVAKGNFQYIHLKV